MFQGPLPDVPGLFVQASVVSSGGRTVSATGIGRSPVEARVRHDSELAERRALSGAGDRQLSNAGDDWPVIAGVAAGRDEPDRVRDRAVLELVERWLCDRWWRGAIPACSPDQEARGGFQDAMNSWPRRVPRRTGLLQVGQAGFPPVCIAWSCDGDGRSVCFGTACRPGSGAAAIAALRELYQMEFGLAVILHRQRNGVPLTASEQRILGRAKQLSVDDLEGRFRCRDAVRPLHDADIRLVFADAGIDLSLNWLSQNPGEHRVVVATSSQLAVVSQAEDRCDTDLCWNLYGA